MKKTFKIFLTMLLALSVFALAGCNSGGDDNDKDADANGETTYAGTVTVEIQFPQEVDTEDMNLSYQFQDGETITDILTELGKTENFAVVSDGSGATKRITSINGVEEKAYGDESGWVFLLNDEFLMESPATLTPKDGDTILWKYVMSMNDL